jgi:hypothetical protein
VATYWEAKTKMAGRQSFIARAQLAAWLGVVGASLAPRVTLAQSEAEDEPGATVDINALFDRAARRAERGDRQSAIRTFKEILPHAPWRWHLHRISPRVGGGSAIL